MNAFYKRNTIKKSLKLLAFILFIVILFEINTRIILSIYFKEPFLLLYPLKAKVKEDMLNLRYVPEFPDKPYLEIVNKKAYLKGTGENSEFIDATTVILNENVYREFHGFGFYKATINSDGYRGKKNEYKQDAKVIFCIGGSSTYGFVNDDLTYPAQLQKYLSQNSHQPYLVYNLGVAGMTSRGYLSRILSLVSESLRPDYVIIYAGYNDAQEKHMLEMEISGKFIEELNKSKYAFLCRHSLLFRQVYISLVLMKPQCFFGKDIIRESLLKDTRYKVGQIIEATKEFNQAFADNILTTIDYVNSIGGRVIYIPEYYNRQISSLEYESRVEKIGLNNMLENQLTVEDLISLIFFLHQKAVKGAINGRYSKTEAVYLDPIILKNNPVKDIFQDEVHLNAKGDYLLAEFIAKKILEY